MKEIPKIKENIDWSEVIAVAEEHMGRLFSGKRVKDDEDHYVFEAVITAIYGKEIWSSYNDCFE